MDSLIGIVAALQQTTARGGAVIGNSLKTIFTRIQRPESIRQIEELGIVVRDLSGAGDTWMASFAYEYTKTQNTDSAIELANKNATLVVQKRGVSTI